MGRRSGSILSMFDISTVHKSICDIVFVTIFWNFDPDPRPILTAKIVLGFISIPKLIFGLCIVKAKWLRALIG